MFWKVFFDTLFLLCWLFFRFLNRFLISTTHSDILTIPLLKLWFFLINLFLTFYTFEWPSFVFLGLLHKVIDFLIIFITFFVIDLFPGLFDRHFIIIIFLVNGWYLFLLNKFFIIVITDFGGVSFLVID